MEKNIMTGPNFSPKTGVGTIWKDPSTGKNWKYTANGWSEDSVVDIATDNKNKGTFVVKPEDESLVKTLKLGGATEESIKAALDKRGQIISATPTDQTASVNAQDVSIDNNPITTKPTANDPFKGKTKTQFLREAFLGGVVDNTELDKLGKTYDLLAAPVATGEMDLTKLSPVQKEAALKQLKKEAVTKMQSLPDAVSRDSALSSLTTFDTGKDIISMLEENKVKTGFIQGVQRQGVFGIEPLGGRSQGKTTKEEDYFAALTETFAANFRKALSGTAVSETEMKRLDRFLPSESKTKQANIEGVLALTDYLSSKTSLQLGVDLSPLAPTEGDADPLQVLGTSGKSKNNSLGI